MDYSQIKKMEKGSIINQVWQFVSKTWIWGIFISIGIIGKFGIDMVQQRKKSIGQAIGQTLVAGFIGYLASIYCMTHFPPAHEGDYSPQGALIVPIATLISDRIMMFLIGIDWHPVIAILSGKSSKGENKKEDK